MAIVGRPRAAARTPRATARPPRAASSLAQTMYLVLYNALSAFMWATVLGRTVAVSVEKGPGSVFAAAGDWTRWTQTLALLEVAHALLGIVRAPVFTTAVQVASRILLVWGIVYPFPALGGRIPYATMLLAWSLTETIRYTFFAVSRAAGAAPGPLTWLRYSTFLVLYPLGISSECLLILAAVPAAREVRPELGWVLYGILAFYVPCSYILYTYMLSQRRKVLSDLRGGSTKSRSRPRPQ